MTIIEGFIAVTGSSLATVAFPKIWDRIFPSSKEQADIILAHSEVEGELRMALHEEIQRLRERCDLSEQRAGENVKKFSRLEEENIECRKRNDIFEGKILRLEADLARHIQLTKVTN